MNVIKWEVTDTNGLLTIRFSYGDASEASEERASEASAEHTSAGMKPVQGSTPDVQAHDTEGN